jgi:hypothetical protein
VSLSSGPERSGRLRQVLHLNFEFNLFRNVLDLPKIHHQEKSFTTTLNRTPGNETLYHNCSLFQAFSRFRMLIVLIVGTAEISQDHEVITVRQRTHHQALDILHFLILKLLAHEQYADRRPHQEEHAETERNEPIQRQQMIRASKDDVQGRGIHNEDAECGASEDAKEVVLVTNNTAAEWEGEFSLDRENLGFEIQGKRQHSVQNQKHTLKHCVMNIERYTARKA